MWWEDLPFLDALCRTGSMGRAAHELGVNKATVSRRVASLERAAPAPLFERRLGRVELTGYGARAIAAYRDHAQSELHLNATLECTDSSAQGTVRLSMPAFLASALIVPALPAFLERRPQLDLRIDCTSRLVDLARAEADIAIRNVRPAEGNLDVRRIGRLGMRMFGSQAYFARWGSLRSARDLRGHTLLSCDIGPYTGPGFEWPAEAARAARVRFSVNDMLSLRDATVAGLGLAVLPQFLGDETGELAAVDEGGVAELWLVTRREQKHVSRVRDVAQFAADVVRASQARLHGMSAPQPAADSCG